MNMVEIKRALRNGGTIEKGSFSGYWLRIGRVRERISGLQAATILPQLMRVDDGSSCVGATFALKKGGNDG